MKRFLMVLTLSLALVAFLTVSAIGGIAEDKKPKKKSTPEQTEGKKADAKKLKAKEGKKCSKTCKKSKAGCGKEAKKCAGGKELTDKEKKIKAVKKAELEKKKAAKGTKKSKGKG